MHRLLATSLLCGGLLVPTASAQVVGRHVFDIVPAQSSFNFSGNVTFSGLSGPIVGNPATFNVSGATSADLGISSSAIATGQFVAGNGTIVTIPTLNAVVPNPIPFLPPLATMRVTGATVVFRSVDVTTGAPQVFPVAPNGTFSMGVVGDVLSGTAVVSGLVNQTIPLAGQSSSPATVAGTFSYTSTGVRLQVSINLLLNFADPGTGASGSLTLTGSIAANTRAFAGDVDSISSTAGGRQVMRLCAGTSRANALYLVLGSASGTTPGLQFGGVNLPLNFDGIMELGLTNANVFPYGNSFTALDARGFGTATFTLPPLPTPLVLQVHHAFAVFNGATVAFASNPIPLALTN
ncbi:MAG: hypothetical protein IPM29_22440 [Planctomycetes bacterium]|nr:hypothetical protein [Planctomycetota bacterium]